jgi:hypothetical protein
MAVALAAGIVGCHSTAQSAAANSAVDQNAGDPADANMAPASGGAAYPPAQVMGQSAQTVSQQQAEDYGPQQQEPAPIVRQSPDGGSGYDNSQPAYQQAGQQADDQAADAYLSDLTQEQASDPPPPLPDYDQPPAPDPDYLWTPGYWAYAPVGYYWVPGCWVAAPYVGALWTPGWWGFVGGHYRFHHGYWGPHIGFYGGVDYGYGYVGHGYYGGYWNGGHFFYNTAVTRVNVNVVRNVYVHNVVINNVVVNNRVVNRVSYNGGRGGVTAQPLPAEVAVLHEQRIPPMASQVQVRQQAAQNKAQFFSVNQGRPAVAVAARPVVADRTLPAPLPRAAAPAALLAPRGAEVRPGQLQGTAPAARPQPAAQTRPQPLPETRNAPSAAHPAPQARPVQPQPEARAFQPQPEARPVQPQPEARPVQPAPQQRSFQPQPGAEGARPAPQPRPQAEARPAPQPRPQPQPQPRPQPAPAPHPQAAPHPQPAARPAPPPHPAPPPKPEPPHNDDKPRR